MESGEKLVEAVKDRYGRIALGAMPSCCGAGSSCDPGPEEAISQGVGYTPGELAEVQGDANLGLGCGAPLRHLALKPGETVLDLGSGAGMDAFLALREVGPAGYVIGVDMTPEMLDRARRGAAKREARNVDFREGRLEKLPVADASVDAVTSNCVINLVPDKKAVFAEVARVLRPGGRMVISDIVLDRPLPEAVAKDLHAYVGCVAGATLRADYFRLVEEAGLGPAEILRDVDYVAALTDAAVHEVTELERATGVRAADLAGSVRSITFRARKADRGGRP